MNIKNILILTVLMLIGLILLVVFCIISFKKMVRINELLDKFRKRLGEMEETLK